MTVLTDDRLTNTYAATAAPPIKYIIILENATVFKTLASYRWI